MKNIIEVDDLCQITTGVSMKDYYRIISVEVKDLYREITVKEVDRSPSKLL
jgi:hypothetical protein